MSLRYVAAARLALLSSLAHASIAADYIAAGCDRNAPLPPDDDPHATVVVRPYPIDNNEPRLNRAQRRAHARRGM